MRDWVMGNRDSSLIRNLLYTVGFLAAATAIGYVFQFKGMQETNIVLVYIVAVFMTARWSDKFIWGIVSSVAATFAFNFFFTEPLFTFSVNNSSYFITFVCMTATAIVTSSLTMKMNRYAKRTEEKERDIHALYAFTSELSSADTVDKISDIVTESIRTMFGRNASFRYLDVMPAGETLTPDESNASDESNAPAAQDTPSAASDPEHFTVKGREGALGIVEIAREDGAGISEEQRTLLNTMLENTGIAVDRIYSSEERYRNQKLMEQEKYRANLLRGISHDLRTPLMGIMGTAEMIEEMSGEDDGRKKLAQDIYQDADWLHSLVENILGLTRLNDGNSLLNKTPEPIEEIISSAIKRVEKRAAGCEIGAELPEEYLEVPADARLLEQVLINLLDNAVKHTPRGNEIKIVVQRQEPEQVRIDVMDRGEGISERDIHRVFEMFYTSSERPVDIKKGIGLGLAICDTIVKAHGGTITASNRDGGGTVFTMILPLAGKGNSDV